MLRRKMLYNLGPLVLMILLTAVGVIWQLEQVLAEVRHIHEHADQVVADIDDFSVHVNLAEVEIYKLATGREQHLDPLISSLNLMDSLVTRLGKHYICHDERGGPLYEKIVRAMPAFRQNLSALATVQDPGLARNHNEASLAVALELREATLPLSQYARDHAMSEQEQVIAQFRRLVLILSLVFLVLINVAVIILLRIATMVIRPVDKLVDATRAIAAGEFEQRITLEQSDEFDELARAYNSMAERLQSNEQARLESINQVALTMNHELNNSMSIIELQLQMLVRKSEGSPAQEQCLRQIRSSLERMSQTTAALMRIRRVVLTDYLPGTKMLDLTRSTEVDDSHSAILPVQTPPAIGVGDRPKKIRSPKTPRGVLLDELRWFVKLRWFAGAGVVIGSLLDWNWLNWSESPLGLLSVGLSILIYNLVLHRLMQKESNRSHRSRGRLLMLAGLQVLLDLAGLMLICLWTGGSASPFIAFFVFHMVFASLLLPWRIAYAGAAVAAILMISGLLLSTHLTGGRDDLLRLVIFGFSLLFTVHLANHLTRAIRRQHRKLHRRNERIRAMSNALQSQQDAMIQHEKMVALGHMAAGVTHEITNPLASMDSLLQLMLRNPAHLSNEKVLSLREQVNRVNGIVQQMKTFARPAHMLSETLPINEVVNRAMAILRYDSRLKKIQIITDLMTDPPSLNILPQAMEQILVNLIQNAIDAIENIAQPTITLRTRGGDGCCKIDVIDNGIGIKPENLGRVFEPFYTTKPVGKGTGLGLSISYSLIQKQNGSLTAHNVPGGGARFTIRLPLQTAAPTNPVDSRNRESAN